MKIEIQHNGETHSFSGTTPIGLWKQGQTRKALEMLMDPFHDLSDRELKFNLEIILQGKEVKKEVNVEQIDYLESLIMQECYKSTPNEQEIQSLYAAIAELEK
jgi:Cu2+-containing amine oxidase